MFHDQRHPQAMGATEVQQFLTDLAVTHQVAASTQNQALSALVFLYKEVLHHDFGWLDDVVHAKKPTRLPVVLTRDEVKRLFQHLSGTLWLMASLFYGAGLRLMECLRLRIKDVDFATHQLTVLEGKGAQPDWVILRSTSGVMTTTALKEAAQVGVPRDKIVGAWGTCAEQAIMPAGEAAIGFICASLFGTGLHFPLIQDILTAVYARGKGPGPVGDVSTTAWRIGMLRSLLTTEAIRTAMHHFGHQSLTGAQVQWGFEHLTLTAASLKALGAEGLIPPLTLSCRDHEGGGGVKFQQWDGQQWHAITDWIATDQALVRPLVKASAAKYAQEKGITPRDCP